MDTTGSTVLRCRTTIRTGLFAFLARIINQEVLRLALDANLWIGALVTVWRTVWAKRSIIDQVVSSYAQKTSSRIWTDWAAIDTRYAGLHIIKDHNEVTIVARCAVDSSAL